MSKSSKSKRMEGSPVKEESKKEFISSPKRSKEKSMISNLEDDQEEEEMTSLKMYDVFNQHFGIDCIHLEGTNQKLKKQRSEIKRLVKENILVQNNFECMKDIIRLLLKPEKRQYPEIHLISDILKHHPFFI